MTSPKVAIIHPFLRNQRGGEQVFYALCQLFPTADLYALIYDPASQPTFVQNRQVYASFVNRLPLAIKHFRHFFPLYPFAVERFNLDSYDLVISSSYAWSHGVVLQPETCHICYCHSPLRYAWNWYHNFVRETRPRWIAKPALTVLMHWIRLWDYVAAQRVDHYIANSEVVRQRIRRYYGRDSVVIHPPVMARRFETAHDPREYYLVVSELMPYKRIDVAISAFNRLRLPLKVVGNGPERVRLQGTAGPTIEFLGHVPQEQLNWLFAHCRALIFTAAEDFGIVPVEAQAAGRPVIAFGEGGVLETVSEGVTGVFYHPQDPDALCEAVARFSQMRFDPAIIRENALRFDMSAFKSNLLDFVGQVYGARTLLAESTPARSSYTPVA